MLQSWLDLSKGRGVTEARNSTHFFPRLERKADRSTGRQPEACWMLGIFDSDLPASTTFAESAVESFNAPADSSSSSTAAAALRHASNSVAQSQISEAFRERYVAVFDALPIQPALRRIAHDFASRRGLLEPGTLACHIRTGLADTWYQESKKLVRRRNRIVSV